MVSRGPSRRQAAVSVCRAVAAVVRHHAGDGRLQHVQRPDRRYAGSARPERRGQGQEDEVADRRGVRVNPRGDRAAGVARRNAPQCPDGEVDHVAGGGQGHVTGGVAERDDFIDASYMKLSQHTILCHRRDIAR